MKKLKNNIFALFFTVSIAFLVSCTVENTTIQNPSQPPSNPETNKGDSIKMQDFVKINSNYKIAQTLLTKDNQIFATTADGKLIKYLNGNWNVIHSDVNPQSKISYSGGKIVVASKSNNIVLIRNNIAKTGTVKINPQTTVVFLGLAFIANVKLGDKNVIARISYDDINNLENYNKEYFLDEYTNPLQVGESDIKIATLATPSEEYRHHIVEIQKIWKQLYILKDMTWIII